MPNTIKKFLSYFNRYINLHLMNTHVESTEEMITVLRSFTVDLRPYIREKAIYGYGKRACIFRARADYMTFSVS